VSGLESPGFNSTGLFWIMSLAPSGQMFNWGDAAANDTEGFTADLLFLAKMSHQYRGAYSYVARKSVGRATCRDGGCALSLLAHQVLGEGSPKDLEALPLSKVFGMQSAGWDGKMAMGIFRQHWDSMLGQASAWAGFKAGNGQANHNDLDAGTFVLEMLGQRFAMDLGYDNYGLKDYWNKTNKGRYRYYRKSTAGHNTLTFNCNSTASDDMSYCGQCEDAVSSITVFNTTCYGMNEPFAVMDLSSSYRCVQGFRPSSVQRGLAFTQGFMQFLIQDEINFSTLHGFPKGANLTWALHTEAEIRLNINPRKAVLALNGALLIATILVPASARFRKESVSLKPPHPPGKSNVSKLLVHIDDTQIRRNETFVLVVGLSSSIAEPGLFLNPLSEWRAKGPINRV